MLKVFTSLSTDRKQLITKDSEGEFMFLILKDTDWKEEDYVKNSIVPFGWVEDNNRAIPSKDEIVAKVQTEEQRNFLLEKLNNKYIRHLRSNCGM